MERIKGTGQFLNFISIFLVFFIMVIILLSKDSCENKMNARNMQKWKTKFELNDISNIAIVLDDNYIECEKEELLRYWKKVKKIYINNQEISPDKLYRKKDFIHEHCGDYFTVLTKKEIDSIVYKFPPVNKYEEYIKGKLINTSKDFYRKRKIQKRLSRSLPSCNHK